MISASSPRGRIVDQYPDRRVHSQFEILDAAMSA
jgi:hypothetical protein